MHKLKDSVLGNIWILGILSPIYYQGVGNLVCQFFSYEKCEVSISALEFQGISWNTILHYNSFCSYLPKCVQHSRQESKQRVTAREITFNIIKKEEGPYWPRLCKEGKKVRYTTLVSCPQGLSRLTSYLDVSYRRETLEGSEHHNIAKFCQIPQHFNNKLKLIPEPLLCMSS